MIKTETIRDYINMVGVCPDCGHYLTPTLAFIVPAKTSYTMDFEETKFGKYYGTKTNYDISYKSEFKDSVLSFYYEIDDKFHKIFSINVDTNKVNGEMEKVQKVIWDFNLSIDLSCAVEQCDDLQYLIKSRPLILERKNNVISHIICHAEIARIEYEKKKYSMISEFGTMKTYVAVNDKIVSNVPLIPIYKIKDRQKILNKIKTLVIFS